MIKLFKQECCDVCKQLVVESSIDTYDIRNKNVAGLERLLLGSEHEKEIFVVFKNEQTEGYPCKPYLSREKLIICPKCMDKMFNGKQLFGEGAQGNNSYYFKEV